MEGTNLETWNWTNVRSLGVAQDLVTIVRAAEEAEQQGEVESGTWSPPMYVDGVSHAYWTQAYELVQALTDTEPGPLPTVVQDAIDRTLAAAEILQLTQPGDHSLR